MTEPADVVLARLDANVHNLMTQMREIKDDQRTLVTRERLEIEIRAREADITRIETRWERAIAEGQTLRQQYEQRVKDLESDRDQLAGGFRLAVIVASSFLAVLGLLVGHLYVK